MLLLFWLLRTLVGSRIVRNTVFLLMVAEQVSAPSAHLQCPPHFSTVIASHHAASDQYQRNLDGRADDLGQCRLAPSDGGS